LKPTRGRLAVLAFKASALRRLATANVDKKSKKKRKKTGGRWPKIGAPSSQEYPKTKDGCGRDDRSQRGRVGYDQGERRV